MNPLDSVAVADFVDHVRFDSTVSGKHSTVYRVDLVLVGFGIVADFALVQTFYQTIAVVAVAGSTVERKQNVHDFVRAVSVVGIVDVADADSDSDSARVLVLVLADDSMLGCSDSIAAAEDSAVEWLMDHLSGRSPEIVRSVAAAAAGVAGPVVVVAAGSDLNVQSLIQSDLPADADGYCYCSRPG